MYLIFFILILCGMVFHEILAPICYFLEQNQIFVYSLCVVTVILYCTRLARKTGKFSYGVSSFFALSQFLVFALSAIYGIVDVMVKEEDTFLSMLMAIIVGVVFSAYGGFNLKMVKSALDEGKENPAYLYIVGIVGWGINLLFTIL